MPYFDGVVGQVYFKAWRVPSPRAVVVFLHGFGEHSGLYHRFANALNGSDIEVWALDEVGHGLSDGDRAVIASIDDLVENGRQLVALAEAANPGRPIVLAGHSLGAVAAAVSASRDPSRLEGLILSGAPLSSLGWVLSLVADDPEGGLDLDPTDLSLDPFYLDELEHDPLAFTSTAGAGSLLATLPPAWVELELGFEAIALPVLFVHGGNDPIVPVSDARSWSARIPDGRITEFPGAHHDVLNETVHREVAAVVADFVISVAEVADPANTLAIAR